MVEDIEAKVADMRRRGVSVEEFPGNEFEEGIRMTMAPSVACNPRAMRHRCGSTRTDR
jgi:hypothetical protein